MIIIIIPVWREKATVTKYRFILRAEEKKNKAFYKPMNDRKHLTIPES